MSLLEEASDVRADDARGNVELPGQLCLDPATGEISEFAQASQDGLLSDPRPQVADRVDFPTSGTPGTGLLPADWEWPRNVRHFFPPTCMSDKPDTHGAPACASAVAAAELSHKAQ